MRPALLALLETANEAEFFGAEAEGAKEIGRDD